MPTTPRAAIPARALLLLGILTLVWGTNWPLFKYATLEISVWTFRSISLLLAGSLLLLVAKARGESLHIPNKQRRSITIATFFYLVVWNIASTYAAIIIPAGQAAILGFTMPIWSALITVIFLKEKMTSRIFAALILGAMAVALLMSRSLGAYSGAPLGFSLGLISGLGWAIGTIILKRSAVTVPVTVLVGWQLLITAIPITAGALILGDYRWFMPSWQTIGVVTYIAIMPMCVGNLCWFSIVGILPTNVAGLSSILVPIVAMISGAIINAEPLGAIQWLAMLCCGASLMLTLLKPATTH